jgi:hypothetical protein
MSLLRRERDALQRENAQLQERVRKLEPLRVWYEQHYPQLEQQLVKAQAVESSNQELKQQLREAEMRCWAAETRLQQQAAPHVSGVAGGANSPQGWPPSFQQTAEAPAFQNATRSYRQPFVASVRHPGGDGQIGSNTPETVWGIQRVAQVFVAWCHRGETIVNRYAAFAEFLKQQVPDATVTPIYRDANAVQKIFGRSGQVTNAVENWLIVCSGQAWLLPQPLNAHQFRDVSCFEGGTISPQHMKTIVPAKVQYQGETYLLESKGRIGSGN